jgi:predicted ATP-grasp superfamily ATP-dependent carboligase
MGQMTQQPEVLVTSCRGADQGALSVIRTLGRHGVRVTVLSDSAHCLTRHSRHCAEFVCRPDFTLNTRESLEWLRGFAARRQTPPVLFPTADPDLALVASLRNELQSSFRMFLGKEPLVASLMDKARFRDLATLHQMPVPATHAPDSVDELHMVVQSVQYPVVLKPSHPGAWTHPEIQKVVRSRKALIVANAQELQALVDAIAPWSHEFVVQEYIVGPDDHHYSVHVYVDSQGVLQACFTGRKVRVHPAFAGSGCYVQSVRVSQLAKLAETILRDIRYTGVAVLNFKQDCRTGRFILHEINPRVSQWNILATVSGVDIPWLAYADAAGIPFKGMQHQTEIWQYVDLRNDLKSLPAYLQTGTWTPARYAASLVRQRTVHQLLSADDPGPFLHCVGKLTHQTGRHLWRRLLQQLTVSRVARKSLLAMPMTMAPVVTSLI